jgi:glycosyltransferase involved in cell wall biosynthesis
MPSAVHVVVTSGFAGVERHVCDTARELSDRNWEVAVVGGDPERMPEALGGSVRWLPGATPTQALRALAKIGQQDICHTHMTFAEAVGVLARPVLRAPVVATRHIAVKRGSTTLGRALSPLITKGISRELAISHFVAASLGRRPDAVIYNGVRNSECLWAPSNRVVLVLQRLEPEKDTLTALRAWREARMWDHGWSLRVVGDGTEFSMLERWVTANGIPSVEFAGWGNDVEGELARAAVLLAPAPREALGLAGLEAMAAGVPVIATGAGGHLETVGRLPGARLFAPGDARGAAARLGSLRSVDAREEQSRAGRALVSARFLLSDRVGELEEQYELVRRRSSGSDLLRRPSIVDQQPSTPASSLDPAELSSLRELIVCSLEPWDDVWRRNQHIVDRLLRGDPDLRVLFIEPSADPVFDVSGGRLPSMPVLRRVAHDGRLVVLRPLKVLPRRFWSHVDASLCQQVVAAARLMRFTSPVLWINDVTYAPLITRKGWPSVYDVTDDWVLAPFSVRERERIRRLDDLAVRKAGEVIVCSKSLERSRGANRSVKLIPNAVDLDLFRLPRVRPADMPTEPTAVYVGSLHDARLDVELVVDLAHSNAGLNLVLVGPDSLSTQSRRLLSAQPNVFCLGARPHTDIPAYLQHADVVIVPHRVSPFTDSLDPIKLYECLATGRPTVATPVAGSLGFGPSIRVAARETFPSAVMRTLTEDSRTSATVVAPSWDDRAQEFLGVLLEVRRS